jgi:hypothetical protein
MDLSTLKAFFDAEQHFMNDGSTSNKEVRISQFTALWRSARYLGNRHVTTGLPLPNEERSPWEAKVDDSPSWNYFGIQMDYVSCMLYLILLDQLGAILQKRIDCYLDSLEVEPNKRKELANRSKIEHILMITKALNWHELSPLEIDAIVTLRHTLAHNFSLGSDPKFCKKESEKLCFRYEFDHQLPTEEKPEFIVMAGIFKGDYEKQNDEAEITKVHVQGLTNFIEELIRLILNEQNEQGFDGRMENTATLFGRFTTRQG